ncbi:pyridine nucleotide-disulfide oxidoreductase [Arthrobacter sp. Soil782]|uniref:dihydrolipoyl dehydrogenase family protein n=1 Tax=Arthrobacter sp. Soil782 TaxID=1736410 RepID=UPI0006FBCA4B|nr:NAD(P)/FAD-dependent oxidoreductase [Arthrobacter sp. Soil782]KRF08585.1 pyridine nucleotide-disulfide oxidoreductase [Arthrobacter sp. Soil782]
MDFDVLVIGAGPAGMAAATRAAELGARTAVVERARLGGTCVNSGCVPTRVLAKTARLFREVRTARDYGIVVHEPAVDWTQLVRRVRTTVDRVLDAKGYGEAMQQLDITLLEGEASFTSPHEVSIDGRTVSAASVILCVGGSARRLPIPGAEHAVLPSDVLDLPELPGSVAIIGGGHTGAQLATIFDALGSRVTLLDLAPRILTTEDHDVSTAVTDGFRSRGVTVDVGIGGVDGIEKHDDGALEIRWQGTGGAQSVRVGAVIMAAGWPANISGLGLEAAGVATARGAIPVDNYLRSNVPHVFVAGDANGTSMLVQAAVFEGETAAENAVLGAHRTTPHHLLPEGGFTDPDYAGVGLTEATARERDAQCAVVVVPYGSVERPIIDDREQGFLKLVTDRHRELILGAHAVGENAVEVIQAVASAMAAGTDVATLARVKFAYPTYSSIIGHAARKAVRGAGKDSW